MIANPEPVSAELVQAAKTGDHGAFERLFGRHVPALRGMLRRMVGHPDDVDDLVQQTLVKAWQALEGYRSDASPSTWLCAIGSNIAIDHLRQRKRWRERAQVIYAASCLESEELAGEVGAALGDPGFTFDVREHISYCFTCIGRTLEPEAQAALVLRDVMELSNEEAAEALGLSRSVLRHHLAEARARMQRVYDGLCALVRKDGICWQCAGLRAACAPGRQGPAIPAEVSWSERLHVVRDALLADSCRPIHEVFFRRTEEQEQEGRGDPEARTNCGLPSETNG